MFAVIKTGGKQYKVAPGDVIKVEKLAGEAGETFDFDQVLMHGSGDSATVGTPLVSGAVVTGEILEQFRDKKVIAFKKRRRKHSSMTRKGHRQYLTAVRIKGIPGDEDGSKTGAARAEAMASAAAMQAKLDAADTADDGHDTAAAMDKGDTEIPAAKSMDDYTRPSNFLDAPVEDGDDLTKLPGLGVASQKQFNEMGVYYYRQFDEWNGDDWDYVEAYVETQLNGRVDVDRASVMVQIKKLLSDSEK
jgi:large subunit ribosomal protein L21